MAGRVRETQRQGKGKEVESRGEVGLEENRVEVLLKSYLPFVYFSLFCFFPLISENRSKVYCCCHYYLLYLLGLFPLNSQYEIPHVWL